MGSHPARSARLRSRSDQANGESGGRSINTGLMLARFDSEAELTAMARAPSGRVVAGDTAGDVVLVDIEASRKLP